MVKRFGVRSTPFLLFLDGDGREIDWVAGYEPPPRKLLTKLRDILRGVDTVSALVAATGRDPRDPAPLIKLGLKFQDRQQREKALKVFEEAISLDSDGSRTFKREMGEIVSCRELAEFQHARTFIATYGLMDLDPLKRFIRGHPTSTLLKEAYVELSRFYRLRDREGRAFLEELVSRFPTDPDILKTYIDRVNEVRGDKDSSEQMKLGLSLAERIEDVYPSITPLEAAKNVAQLALDGQEPERAEAAYGMEAVNERTKAWAGDLLNYAEFWFLQKRNHADAQAAMMKALALRPDDPEVRRRVAAAFHHHLSSPDKALEVYGAAVFPQISNDAQALYDYFKFWMGLNANLTSASDALEAIWTLKPNDFYYRLGAANVYLKAKLTEKALAVFGPEFAASRQNDFPALYEYGNFWLRQSLNVESAMPALVRALRESPSIWTKHWSAAQMLARQQKLDAALEVFGPAFLPHIAEDVDALAVYANFWCDQKTNSDSALRALEMALCIEDLPSWQLDHIGFSFIKAGRPERVDEFYAEDHLTKIGDDPMSLMFYASFWHNQGRHLPSALKAIERACEIEKESSRNWAVRARVLLSLGRVQEALRSLEKAVSLDTFKDSEKELEDLRKQILEASRKTTKTGFI